MGLRFDLCRLEVDVADDMLRAMMTNGGLVRREARRIAVIAVWLAIPIAAERGADAQAQPAVGDTVRIEMDEGAVEGVLVDRLPTGYLIRTGAGTQVVAYDSVRSIGLVGATPQPTPEPQPQPTPAETAAPEPIPLAESTTPPAPETSPEDFPIDRWMLLRFHYLFGVQPHIVYSAVASSERANNSGVDSELALMVDVTQDFTDWLAIGFDAVVDITERQVVDPGEQGCEFLGNCYPFENGLSHETITAMFTLWGKPYYRFGNARAWAGIGFNVALVNYLYTFSSGSGYSGSDTAFSVGAGAGADYIQPLSRKFGLVGSLSLMLGSPVYDEEISNFVEAGNTYQRSAVGHAVVPWRLGVGVGIAMGSASTAPPPAAVEGGGGFGGKQ